MFSQGEKEELLFFQLEVLQKIIPLYKEYQNKGQIEISASPFYHPIIPLVYDNKIALECLPHAKLPEPIFSAPDDAQMQIVKSKKYYEEKFGRPLLGMWPSEGSVSNDAVGLFAQNDIQWIATDEQILFNSLDVVSDRSRTLYHPYKMNIHGKDINLFFRDHNLSDNIGFNYSKMPSKDAASDLHNHLRNIFQYIKQDNKDHIVSIILDGENPWEYYYDSGEEFLHSFYSKIENDPDLESITFSDYIKQYDHPHPLKKIYAGSWINHNFSIWIDDDEKNKGWSLLQKTRKFLTDFIQNNPNYDKIKIEQAWEDLYQAEGSDWFWWYGDDFSTENDEEFDMLFRKHLKNVYLLLDSPVPDELNIPISEKAKIINISQPRVVSYPLIDGRVNNFFEWWGAGKFIPSMGTTMARNIKTLVKELYYGYNNDNLFLRFDFENLDKILAQPNLELKINFIRPERNKIIFKVSPNTEFFRIISSSDKQEIKHLSTIKIKEIAELSIPFIELDIKYADEVYFFIEVMENEKVIETLPYDSYIYFKAPPQNFKSLMWIE